MALALYNVLYHACTGQLEVQKGLLSVQLAHSIMKIDIGWFNISATEIQEVSSTCSIIFFIFSVLLLLSPKLYGFTSTWLDLIDSANSLTSMVNHA